MPSGLAPPARHGAGPPGPAVRPPAEAVPILEQTLDACERLLGADDPRTEAVRHNLPLAHQGVGA
jgi:hypothetical protein